MINDENNGPVPSVNITKVSSGIWAINGSQKTKIDEIMNQGISICVFLSLYLPQLGFLVFLYHPITLFLSLCLDKASAFYSRGLMNDEVIRESGSHQ